MTRIDGAVAVVTGAASGIGRASAIAFAREGADVVCADVDEPGARAVAAVVEAGGRRALAVRTDVASRDDVEALVDRAIKWQGHCDIFFSNAGVAVSGGIEDTPLDDWEWIVDINLWSHVWATRRVLPHMLERGSGHLVHTASAAGLLGQDRTPAYCVTKFAVVGLAESLAIHCHGTGVGVSVVCPLGVNTGIFEATRASFPEGTTAEQADAARRAAKEFMLATALEPEAVADAILAGVREDRLYVFPHPALWEFVRNKWEDPERWIASMARLSRKIDPLAR